MSDAGLEQLLRQADRAFGSPKAGPADLAARVRRQARRQRRVMTFGAAAAALLILVVGTIALVNGPGKSPPPGNRAVVDNTEGLVPLAQLQKDIARLQEEISSGCKAAEEALRREEAERRLAALGEQAAADPLKEVSDQVDRAALTMVYQADRMCRELNLRASAIASYEQTIKLFPQTHWAQVAKHRLAELKTAGEGDAI